LYGVRTEATKTYYRAKKGEKIHYLDVIRLYPYICKYGKFPLGHPKVYVGAECPPDCLDREGIVKYRFCLLGNCIIRFFYTKATPN